MSHLNLHKFNLLAFIRAATNKADEISGQLLLSQLTRLATEKAPDTPVEAPITWHLRYAPEAQPHFQKNPIIELALNAEIWLVCQRCLQPYLHSLSNQHRFEVVKSEMEADAAAMDDDEKDAVVGSEEFDLCNLIEDELLLSLPLIPHHLTCQHPVLEQIQKDFLSDEESVSPFAKLAALKEKKRIH